MSNLNLSNSCSMKSFLEISEWRKPTCSVGPWRPIEVPPIDRSTWSFVRVSDALPSRQQFPRWSVGCQTQEHCRCWIDGWSGQSWNTTEEIQRRNSRKVENNGKCQWRIINFKTKCQMSSHTTRVHGIIVKYLPTSCSWNWSFTSSTSFEIMDWAFKFFSACANHVNTSFRVSLYSSHSPCDDVVSSPVSAWKLQRDK